MKVVFLHLSDIHVKNRHCINLNQIHKMVDSLNSMPAFTRVIIVVSGDVAHSGEKAQYDSARNLFGHIITELKKRFGYNLKYDFLCIPGNHDVSHIKEPKSTAELEELRTSNRYDRYIEEELAKQEEFFKLANYNHCFLDNKLFSRKLIDCDGFFIEANMFNSAIFSILNEDKGLHYLPQYCINDYSSSTGADFVITVMHHAPDWFVDNIKNQLERVIYRKSSLVFYGHEHYPGKKEIKVDNCERSIVQAGGCLAENDNWRNSSYHVGVLDTESFVYNHYEFVWDENNMIYKKTNEFKYQMNPKPSREIGITISDDFLKDFKKDAKNSVSANFMDYFVFPRIRSVEKKGDNQDYTQEETFIDEILNRKRLLICGGYNSGKTTLLKKLVLSLYEKGYSVLFCDADNISKTRYERAIKNCFEDMYGSSSVSFAKYEQISKNKKILFVDNADSIKKETFKGFYDYITDNFEYCVFASKQVYDFDLIDKMKAQLNVSNSIHRYHIMPLFSDKREVLIRNLVSIKVEDSEMIEQISCILMDSINAQKKFISNDPDFIIKYVDYYFKNIGEPVSGDSGIFSKVFEANLTNKLSKHASSRMSVDKIFKLLSKIAHYIHFHKAYPINQKQIIEVIDHYVKKYGGEVQYVELINAATESRILVLDIEKNGYRFANKSYLAYFVAREINVQYNETGDDYYLQAILKYSCFGINSDILLFLSYITQNIRILRLILDMATEYTKEWIEFDFDNNMPKYLLEAKTFNVKLPTSSERKEDQEAALNSEIEVEDSIETLDIYDYSEEEAENFVNQLVRAMQLLIVISKCLPNFEHDMLKEDKEKFVDMIYRLPNKIFALWSYEADKHITEIIQFFKEQSQDYYTRQKKLTDDDLVKALQWTSISFLLDLYNACVTFSAKENTLLYLAEFNYSKKITYSLEHLLILEKCSSGNSFTEKSLELFVSEIPSLAKVMISRIVKHAIIYKRNLSMNSIQQLEAKIFSAQKQIFTNKAQKKKELILRHKNRNVNE